MMKNVSRLLVISILTAFTVTCLPITDASAGVKGRHAHRKERRKDRRARRKERHQGNTSSAPAAVDSAPKSE